MKLALCDSDTRYLECFIEYLESKEDCNMEILGFTSTETLLVYGTRDERINILIISEEMYEQDVEKVADKTVILDEGLGKQYRHAFRTDKYQQAREIYRFVMEILAEEDAVSIMPPSGRKARIIGFYSPIKRAMQTSFALALGRSLSTRYRVLFVSFEVYAGWLEEVRREGGKDLYDLLYYLKESKDKFLLKFNVIAQTKGQMSYIPPVRVSQNLVYVTMKEWLTLISRLKELEKFDFILLDLSDSLQGIFEILRLCEKIFTVTGPDKVALCKVEQYEYLLRLCEYDDVKDKSLYKMIPEFEQIPDDSDWWTHDVWRQFIRKVEEEDLGIESEDYWQGRRDVF